MEKKKKGEQQIEGKGLPPAVMLDHYDSYVSKSVLFPRKELTKQ